LSTTRSSGRFAILFWFYKDFDLCRERLLLLRRLNPETPIYGLYGGPLEASGGAEALSLEMDDLYIYPEPRDSHWKWLNGDQVIAHWMRARGGALTGRTIVVVQWDMLVLAPIDEVFAGLAPGEAVFSGFRPLQQVEPWWGWASGRDPEKRAMLDDFQAVLRTRFGYEGPLWCALFIVVAIPDAFLARYASEAPEEGFLEYKMPTLARAWGVPVRTDLGLDPWWAADPSTREVPERARALNAVGREIPWSLIQSELADATGLRVFHPYSDAFPPDALSPGSAATSA
jgi:hypothetical protein